MSADMKPDAPLARAARGVTIAKAHIESGCKAFGDRYLPVLQAMQVLTDADYAAFELMSVHHVIAWAAAGIVEKDGLILIDKFGQAHKHPALQILRDNSALFKAYAAEFGMTPSARSRIQVPLPDEPSQLEMELFGEEVEVGG
jgi:P27 family predicted phage terminase small subunit